MVQAALTPLADRQQMATYWLFDYFTDFGDHAPNSTETSLSVATKKALWVTYRDEMTQLGHVCVTYEKFIELWNAIFPHFRTRPWINIPGKCDTCYRIDTMRRQSNSRGVHEALKQCHHLHRGGMFMQERRE